MQRKLCAMLVLGILAAGVLAGCGESYPCAEEKPVACEAQKAKEHEDDEIEKIHGVLHSAEQRESEGQGTEEALKRAADEAEGR